MALFEYTGLTSGGTAITGQIEAADPEQAREDLARMRIELNELRKAEQQDRSLARLSEDDLIFFNGQLASLAQAGIALDEGLAQLARDVQSAGLRNWLEGLVEDLRRGLPMNEAIARRETGLPVLYSQVISAGIQSGDLPGTLLNLNQHLKLAGDTRRMIWEVSSYPVVVALVAMTIFSGVFTILIPHFKQIFADFGTSLPAITELLIGIADWCSHGGIIVIWLLPALVLLCWYLLRYARWGLQLRESILMHLPVIGRIYNSSLLARFLRAISTAVTAGMPLPQAMRLSAGVTGNSTLQREAGRLALEVERGESIFVASQSTRIIPALFGFCAQVSVGRESLPQAMSQLARAYENRAVHTQSMLRTLLFPAMVLLLGGMIAFVIIGMFLPLVTLINCVSSGG